MLYHAPHRRPLQDVLSCVREKTTIQEAGLKLEANAERHLKRPLEMARLFRGHEEALARTLEIAAACTFNLEELVYEYPDEPTPPGKTPQAYLEELAWEGAHWRFPDGIPDKVRALIVRELQLIDTLHYAQYFLTVRDIVHFARSKDILCQGRGSAANSVVCYCLAITAVNPTEIDVLFDRFVSPERKEPPDIDVDFEHERREEVIQYIYARYGRDRAGLAATVISYRARSAVRDVGKAMGLSEDTVAALAGMVWGTTSGGELPEKHVRAAGLDPDDPLLATVLELAHELMGFPRHLSQHVGGFVLTRGPLVEVVPVGNAAMDDRTFIEWDKDDIAALGLLKVDVLALGMLTCIRKAFDLIKLHEGTTVTLASVPREDSDVYDMLCKADSVGVFQVESRAQMNMLPRLKPRTFYDLVIEVAIVRPGPIQGDMVHPYLRRRDGVEAEHYPSPSPAHGPKDELRNILGKTKGVPLFQEQAMRIALVAAKFSDAEVNELRKAMATFRRRGTIGLLEEKMVSRMAARGYDRDFAQRCFNQIKGFGEYGFPESHAASFAHLVYVSSWIKCHHPAAFAAALLNSQPMGFYAPAQIVRDAREHGVEARAADVNLSDWDCTLEAGGADARPALRLGLRQIDGLQEDEVKKLVAARAMIPSPHRFFSDGERVRVRGRGWLRRKLLPLTPALSPHAGRAEVPRRARPVGAGAAAADQPGKARGGGCLPLRPSGAWLRQDGPRSPPGAVGRQGAGRRRAAAAVFLERDARSRRRAVRAAARDAFVGARRQRLPDAAPVAEGAPDELPARAFRGAPRARLRRPARRQGRHLRRRRRRRPRAPAPRLGQGRRVHDHRGRDGRRQRGGVAEDAGALPQGGDGRPPHRHPRPHPAARGHHPRRLRQAGGSQRLAAAFVRAGQPT